MGQDIVEIKLGQQWYFYEYSNSFIVYKIEHIMHKYYDGDVASDKTVVHLRSQGNSVIMRDPLDFTENRCKLILNVQAHVPVDITIVPINVKNRLEKIDD